MKGVVINADNTVEIKDFTYPLHESCYETLDGHIEIVNPRGLRKPFCMLVNDEGLLKDLPINMLGTLIYGYASMGCAIVGNVIIMKTGMTEDGPDIVGLSDTEARIFQIQISDTLTALRRSVII